VRLLLRNARCDSAPTKEATAGWNEYCAAKQSRPAGKRVLQVSNLAARRAQGSIYYMARGAMADAWTRAPCVLDRRLPSRQSRVASVTSEWIFCPGEQLLLILSVVTCCDMQGPEGTLSAYGAAPIQVPDRYAGLLVTIHTTTLNIKIIFTVLSQCLCGFIRSSQ
jgi:hypothetical protein